MVAQVELGSQERAVQLTLIGEMQHVDLVESRIGSVVIARVSDKRMAGGVLSRRDEGAAADGLGEGNVATLASDAGVHGPERLEEQRERGAEVQDERSVAGSLYPLDHVREERDPIRRTLLEVATDQVRGDGDGEVIAVRVEERIAPDREPHLERLDDLEGAGEIGVHGRRSRVRRDEAGVGEVVLEFAEGLGGEPFATQHA